MKFVEKFNSTIRVFCAILLIIMTLLVLFQIASRKFFNISVAEVEELARYCMIWTALIGSSLGVYSKSHVGVEIISEKLKGNSRKVIAIFTYIVMALIFTILLIYGIKLTIQGMSQNSTSMPFLKMGYVMLVVPFSGLIGLINLIALTFTEVKKQDLKISGEGR